VADTKPTVDERGRASAPQLAEPELPSRYASGDEIARGGMGRVLEATDTLLGRAVAIKEALTTDPDALRRFVRETRITARLEHPSIVPVYDAGTDDAGKPYYVMRKVSGRPLDQLVEDSKSLNERLALLPHVLAAAQAVAHAHRRGVLHRDLKPTNILVGDLGETVVIDWGLAKVVGEADEMRANIPPSAPDLDDDLRTRIGAVIGTPGFMAPEQLRGETVDARGDVYALGATLYYLFAQQPPHSSASVEDMMVAAAKAPPKSIAVVAPGVPPEVATIVDKALAFDDRERYPDAGALAEDLQRFLTGQLVASHRYSGRERIVRFVRRNRVAVIVATAALVTLVVGGWFAIAGILDARDDALAQQRTAEDALRAAETAKQRADDRADEMTLLQARALLESNPTAAVAIVKPLAGGTHWRQVRAIAAAARAAGVAWEMPGPARPRALAVSPDGKHAVSTGLDGTVRYYDLVHHTTREVITLLPDRNAAFADDDHLLLWDEHELAIVDVHTLARRDLEIPDGVRSSLGTRSGIYWITGSGAVWRIGTRDAAPQRIAIDDMIQLIVASPDGRWLAASGDRAFHVLDLDPPTPVDRVVAAGEATMASWDPRSTAVAARVGSEIVVAGVDPPRIVSRYAADTSLDVAQVMGSTYAIGSYAGIRMFKGADAAMRLPALRIGVGLRAAHVDTVVATASGGRLVVLAPTREVVIGSPVDTLRRIATSPTGRYVVAAGDGHVLVWDLDAMLPERREIGQMSQFHLVRNNQLIIERLFDDWDWVDLGTGESWKIQPLMPVMAILGNWRGDRAVAIEPSHHQAFEIRRGERAVTAFSNPVEVALFLPDDSLLLATPTGDVIHFHPKTHTSEHLTSHPSGVSALEWQDHWIAAQFDDGMLWRRDTDTGVEQRIDGATSRGTRMTIQLVPDGRVFAIEGNRMRVWQRDGSLIDHATLPTPVLEVIPFSLTFIVVITTDHAVYLVSLAQPNQVHATVSAGVEFTSIAGERGFAAATHDDGRVEVVDLLGGAQWSLGKLTANSVVGVAQISTRGDLIAAQLGQDALVLFRLDVPDSAADTARWLDELTNATTEHGPASLTWRHPPGTGRSPPSVIQRVE